MADEDQENTLVNVVTNFLLNPDIKDYCTLEEFKNYFPSKYRNHDDIKCLHNMLVSKRQMIKETVRHNIEKFYSTGKNEARKGKQSLEDVLSVLVVKKKLADQELSRATSELEVLQSNIIRCDKAVQDCHFMRPDSKKYFSMDLFKRLDSHVQEKNSDD